MSKTAFKFHATRPPEPDVYTTRRNGSKYLTLRYWDGVRWFSFDYGGQRGAKPFKWPKGSRSRKPAVAKTYALTMCLRRIGDAQQTGIEWGDAYTVYDRKEVLAFLVETGVLRPNWEAETNEVMRRQLS